MEEQIKVPDISALARILLDIIKTISKSGNVLNNATLSQFLSKNQKVRYTLQLAHKAEKESEKPAAFAKEHIIRMEEEERAERERKAQNEIIMLDTELDREKDMNKRAVLTLISLAKVESNEKLFDMIDEFKQLVIDEADVDERERVLDSIKKQLLSAEITVSAGREETDSPKADESQSEKKSLLGRFFGSSTSVNLNVIQNNLLKVLQDLKSVLGEAYFERIERMEERIKQSDDIEYLFSLRNQFINLIKEFAEKLNEERESFTGFMQNIGDRLQEMEEDINHAFSNSNQRLEEDQNFNDKLNAHIKDIGNSVEKSTGFDQLKTFIVQEMTRIADTLEEKSREYKKRLEEAQLERDRMKSRFKTMIGNVIEQNKVLVEQSKKDTLTGIINRATFDDILTVELQRYQRYSEPFSIIMFDIDHFKNINDTYGHVAGDKVLKGIAGHISNMLRKTDIFARYGGEEFIILLPNTEGENTIAVAEKLRQVIEEAELLYEGNRVPITASIGVTEVLPGDDDITGVVKRVDACMYRAKENGRNCVSCDFKKG